MYRWQSNTHALIGLWILAGLAVAGVNGYKLMSLLDAPLAGYSSEVRSADRGFRQYRMLLTAETEKINLGMDLLASWFKPVVVQDAQAAIQNVSAPQQALKKVKAPALVLPALTGVITSRSTDGTVRRMALLDGRICIQGDLFGTFTVKRITSQGVSLVSGDHTWLLKAPENSYSVATQ